MRALLRRLFAPKPERHFPLDWMSGHQSICACGHHSPWDYDLRKHFTDMERIGK